MKKSPEWECKEGCDLSEKTCPHLEKLLPQMNSGDMPQFLASESVANMSMSIFEVQFPVHTPEIMLDRIRSYGILDEWDLELLEATYFRNLSSYDVAKELGYISPETVQRRLRRIRALLKERGYDQELW